jgi:hypothetical protein
MKRQNTINRPGFRSTGWLKVPIRHRDEFVIGGYLPSPPGYSTLILGQFNQEGNYICAGFLGPFSLWAEEDEGILGFLLPVPALW